jgi:hypothetical protein
MAILGNGRAASRMKIERGALPTISTVVPDPRVHSQYFVELEEVTLSYGRDDNMVGFLERHADAHRLAC